MTTEPKQPQEKKYNHVCLGMPGCNHPVGTECSCQCHTPAPTQEALSKEAWKRKITMTELIRRMIAYFKATLKANKDLI